MKKLFVLLYFLLVALMTGTLVLGVAAGHQVPVVATGAEEVKQEEEGRATDPDTAAKVTLAAKPQGQPAAPAALPAPVPANDPVPPDVYYSQGMTYVYSGEMDKAIAEFSEAIRIHPGYLEAYYNRGYLYLYTEKNYDQAIADYNEAIRINPNFAAAYYDRGNLYMYTGDMNKAIAEFSEAIRINPDYLDAYINRGYAYVHQYDYGHARADYEKALQIDPGDIDARGNLEQLRKKMGH